MNYSLLPRVSWTFRAFRQLLSWDVPGAWRLYELLGRHAFKSKIAPFPLEDGSTAYVPLTWPGMVTGRGLDGYETGVIAAFAAQVKGLAGPVTLIDCGADIGIFARLVLAKVPNVCRVIAYEPNPDPYAVLKLNLDRCGTPADARQSAVSSTPGQAVLVVDTAAEHDHAAFIAARGQNGLPVAVETIDQLDMPPATAIALKIDVEGEELRVLQGAANTLRHCSAFVVQFEAHPGVATRTGVDPSSCLTLLRDLGAQRWVAYSERTGSVAAHISPDRPFFEQALASEIYNVIAVRDAPTCSHAHA